MRAAISLQRTLSLHFLLVAILPVLLFGLIATSLLHSHLRRDIYTRNQALVNDIAVASEQFLLEVEHDLTTVSRVISAGSIIPPGSIDSYLQTFVQQSGRFESIYFLDRHKRVRHLGLTSRISLQWEDFRGADFSRHDLFQKYSVIDSPVWSDTFISLVTGEPSVTLAMPVPDGTLFGIVSLQHLSRQLARFKIEARDSCAIVDHIGTLVASSDPQQAMQRINLRDHVTVVRALHGTVETMQERHGDLELLESAATISHTGWVAWVGVDFDARMAPVEYLRNLLAGFMLMAMLLAAWLALIDARRLMRPLANLSARAGEIGAGHYDMVIEPCGFTEIDNLAGSLREMCRSIHDRESSLISSEQRFRDLVNSIDGVVWELDMRSGRYLFVSDRSLTLFGYAPEKWLDDPGFWAHCVHDDDRERVVVRGGRSLALDANRDLEYRFVTADGTVQWVRDLVTVIWENEEPIRLLGVAIDISARKRAEEELQSYRTHLEELVAQRTGELKAAQGELVKNERLAVLGQLTATVSHEIRNPLGTVANSLYLLRDAIEGECLQRAERPLALAERSVQRCDGIIGELLDFTRRPLLQSEPLFVDTWLAEVLDELQWPAKVRRDFRLASGAVVQADSERLRRALVNVIENALHAMAGRPERILEITTARQEDRCEIKVRDTGAGMPPEVMERIFEPLFSTKNFGVGLGVPIIQNIMNDHGGGVSYASAVGEGTTVTLWLPLAVEAGS